MWGLFKNPFRHLLAERNVKTIALTKLAQERSALINIAFLVGGCFVIAIFLFLIGGFVGRRANTLLTSGFGRQKRFTLRPHPPDHHFDV